MISPFRHAISLRRSRRSELWNNSTTLQMIIKLLTQIFTSTIRWQKFDRLAELILYFILKLLELFKGLRLVPHQVDISISAQVVGESHEVLVTTSSSRAHWSTHISMYEFQQVGRFSQLFAKGVLVILPSRHDSHVSNDSKSNEFKSPSSCSFFMRFSLI